MVDNKFDIFKYRICTKSLQTLDEIKDKLLKQKIIHNKYKNKMKFMDERQLKNFIYVGVYEETEFGGIGKIFMYINKKDLKSLIAHILVIDLNVLSILRLMIHTIENVDKYNNKFLIYLLNFKNVYESKFKKLLFDIGVNYKIDKLDLIYLFLRLLYTK